MTFGFRCSPPAPSLTASSCSYGREFAIRFFQLRLTATPCGFATVAVIGSGWLLSSNKTLPMLGTLGHDGILRPDGIPHGRLCPVARAAQKGAPPPGPPTLGFSRSSRAIAAAGLHSC